MRKAFDKVQYLIAFNCIIMVLQDLFSAFLDDYTQSIVLWFYINLSKCYWWCTLRDDIRSLVVPDVIKKFYSKTWKIYKNG